MNIDIVINILLVVVLVITGFMIYGYNVLVKRQNHAEESESNIQIYLEKRFDLVPNLVEVVKGYTKHEEDTIKDVVKAREKYGGQFSVSGVDAAEKSINRLIAIAEKYPNLKADTQYLSLSHKLAEIEDEIERVRRTYNRVVTGYNTKVQTVPFSLVAKIFNFKKKDLFRVEAEEKQEAVKIKM